MTNHPRTLIYIISGVVLALLITASIVGPTHAPDRQVLITSTSPLPIVKDNKDRCLNIPAIYYHHVQDMKYAKELEQEGLTVDTKQFIEHLEYLRLNAYTVIHIEEFMKALFEGKSLPPKPILLTFDDGYEDFYTNVFPLLKMYNYPALVFLPTGLVDTKGYLKWGQIEEMKNNGLVYFGNHTWTHTEMKDEFKYISEQITKAEQELTEKSLNEFKVFTYPYGTIGEKVINYLQQNNYNLAFTTEKGSKHCTQNRLLLPRIGVKNLPLSQQLQVLPDQ